MPTDIEWMNWTGCNPLYVRMYCLAIHFKIQGLLLYLLFALWSWQANFDGPSKRPTHNIDANTCTGSCHN